MQLFKLKPNMNRLDRWMRLSLAALFLLSALLFEHPSFLVGALFIFFELALNWCALYHLLGINHCPLHQNKEDEGR